MGNVEDAVVGGCAFWKSDFHGFAALDVTKRGGWIGRLDAEGDDSVWLLVDDCGGGGDGLLELMVRLDDLIGGHDDHGGVGVVAAEEQGGESDAGGGVALAGFAYDMIGEQSG